MSTGTRPIGDFCWINMLTPQPAAAREFFARVLGWTYVEMPGMGHRVQVGGRDIGGLFDLDGPATPPGTPPLIGVMVKVANADDAAAHVTSLGGHARDPFDIMDQGRMAVCRDPNGAEFDVWEPKKGQGTDADSALHGAPCWFETMTSDAPRAARFYSALFGWTAEPMPRQNYTVFRNAGQPVAGILPAANGALRPHWAAYFTVRNADETAALAAAAGATVCVAPQHIPGVGRFAGITSPQGVTFYVIAYER